jgi:hypothetical protein
MVSSDILGLEVPYTKKYCLIFVDRLKRFISAFSTNQMPKTVFILKKVYLIIENYKKTPSFTTDWGQRFLTAESEEGLKREI